MFDNGTEVIVHVGHVFFRGFVRATFIWRGCNHVVVTNADNIFVAKETNCTHARPVLVIDE